VTAEREPVDVWAASLDTSRLDGSACNHGEHDRAARFRDHLVGARWLAARHLLRTRLAVRLGCDPHDFEFEEGAHGKPRVPGIEFNLAHSGGIAVVAIAGRAVGVDIEVPRRLVRPTGVARRLGLDWEALPCHDRAGALLRAWTRTEALVKATGDGASGGLSHVEERLAPDGWVVVDVDLGAAAVGAVAARGRDWTVVGPTWVEAG
jgi:4'-phosphopantetheinyl transferase